MICIGCSPCVNGVTNQFNHTAVRLKLEQNQLVDVCGEISVRVNGLKGV